MVGESDEGFGGKADSQLVELIKLLQANYHSLVAAGCDGAAEKVAAAIKVLGGTV